MEVLNGCCILLSWAVSIIDTIPFNLDGEIGTQYQPKDIWTIEFWLALLRPETKVQLVQYCAAQSRRLSKNTEFFIDMFTFIFV